MKRRRSQKNRQSQSRRKCLTGFQPLEDRQLLTTFMVDAVGDVSDGDFSTGNQTLREAVEQANANPGIDEITFAAGIDEIQLTQQLGITSPLEITGNVLPGGKTNIVGNTDTDRIFDLFGGTQQFTLSNLSLTGGGSFSLYGGAIQSGSSQTSITITNSSFEDNKGLRGGAINAAGPVTITDSEFLNNEAATRGGAIRGTGAVTISNSSISGNTAELGGAIAMSGGSLTVQQGSTLGGDTASDANTATNYGGAIFGEDNTAITINNSSVSGNTVNAGGGGILIIGGTLVIENSSTIGGSGAGEGNSATAGFGGGIWAQGSAVVTINESTVSGNMSHNHGGGIVAISGSQLTINDSTLTGNSSSIGNGGAIRGRSDAVVTINNTTVSDNSAVSGGGISADTNAQIIVQNGSMLGGATAADGNTAQGGNGGAILAETGAVVLLAGSTVRNNKAINGGGIYSSSTSVLTITNNSLISDNVAEGIETDRDAAGGGIYSAAGAVLLTDSTVSGNRASGYNDEYQNGGDGGNASGGGIYANGNITLVDSHVNANTASGGYSYFDNGGSCTGGGIHGNGDITLTGSTVMANSVVGGGSYYQNGNACSGGGIRGDSGSTITLTSSTVANNQVTGASGDNYLEDGSGGAAFGGGIFTNDDAIVITGSTISGNTARGGRASYYGRGGDAEGGGLFGRGSFAILNSTISGNQAVGGRGGNNYIYEFGGGRGGNANGGGVDASGDVTFRNSTMTENSVTAGAGYDDGFSAGAGLHGSGSSTVIVESSIVAGNEGGSDFRSATVTAAHSLIGDTSGTTITGTGNVIGVDPQLGPLADNGGPTETHAILAGSPAINAGDPAAMAGVGDTPQFDQRGSGFSRVKQGRMDIGAFESNFDNAETPSLIVTIATDTVDNTDNETSLREAVDFANSDADASTITFAAGLSSVNVTGSQLNINESLTIDGPGADQLTINGNSGARLFETFLGTGDSFTVQDITLDGAGNSSVLGGAIASLNDMSVNIVRSVLSGNTGDQGGAINSFGSLTIENSMISGNTATAGGGIGMANGDLTVTNSTFNGNTATSFGGGLAFTDMPATITNSTFSGNTAGIDGGAIDATYHNNTLTIRNSTIVGNTATNGDGGGLYGDPDGGNILENTTIANNSAGAAGNDVFHPVTANFSLIEDTSGTTITGMGNVIGVDPQLGPLANNGGPTLTHKPQPGSPAINAGDPAAMDGVGNTPQFDQRADGTFRRVSLGRLDIGSIEVLDPVVAVDDSFTASVGSPFSMDVTDNDIARVLLGVSFESGTLPPGLSLELDGTLSGTPTTAGTFTFTYEILDLLNTTDTAEVTVIVSGDSLVCDFDNDGDCDGADINALQANIVAGPSDPGTFDLTGDGEVTVADRDQWLAVAGAENLASGNAYLPGDANLDGVVDASDFNIWNGGKFTANSNWTNGDFNSDGFVDGSDFNIWNGNKFTSADSLSRSIDSGDEDREEKREAILISVLDRMFAELE